MSKQERATLLNTHLCTVIKNVVKKQVMDPEDLEQELWAII